MRKLILTNCIVLLLLACGKPPAVAPAAPQTIWIDLATHSDTIITNVNNQYTILYYAARNWQISSGSFSHGYRTIAIRSGDSILVKPVDDVTTNYYGPFLLKTSSGNDTLTAQNFMDTAVLNPARLFVLLH